MKNQYTVKFIDTTAKYLPTTNMSLKCHNMPYAQITQHALMGGV